MKLQQKFVEFRGIKTAVKMLLFKNKNKRGNVFLVLHTHRTGCQQLTYIYSTRDTDINARS